MTEERDRSVYMKLEAVKDLKPKIIALDRIRARLAAEVELVQTEDISLNDYRSELELLQQEKMAHVEELRQIHADINAMENIIKAAQELRGKGLEHARRLHDDYLPLKQEVARICAQHLDLNFPNLIPDEDPVPPNFFDKAGIDWSMEHDDLGGGSSSTGLSMSTLSSMGGGPPSFLSPQPPSLTPLRSTPHKVDQRPLPPPPGPPTPTFRQQPPPMKSCLSCHQQIHRNAPICPLCKAKSRSRNPKKPKKKE